jgi:hypothetical protein
MTEMFKAPNFPTGIVSKSGAEQTNGISSILYRSLKRMCQALEKSPAHFTIFREYKQFLKVVPSCDAVTKFAVHLSAYSLPDEDRWYANLIEIVNDVAKDVKFLGKDKMDFSTFAVVHPDIVAYFDSCFEAAGTSWDKAFEGGQETLWSVLRQIGIKTTAKIALGTWRTAYHNIKGVQGEHWVKTVLFSAFRLLAGIKNFSLYSIGAFVIAIINLVLNVVEAVRGMLPKVISCVALIAALVSWFLPIVFTVGNVGAWVVPYVGPLLCLAVFVPKVFNALQYFYKNKLQGTTGIVDAVAKSPLRLIPNVVSKIFCFVAPVLTVGLFKCAKGTTLKGSEIDKVIDQHDGQVVHEIFEKFLYAYLYSGLKSSPDGRDFWADTTDLKAEVLGRLANLQFFIVCMREEGEAATGVSTTTGGRYSRIHPASDFPQRPRGGGRSRSRHASLGLHRHKSNRRHSRRSRHRLGTTKRSRSSRFGVLVSGASVASRFKVHATSRMGKRHHEDVTTVPSTGGREKALATSRHRRRA